MLERAEPYLATFWVGVKNQLAYKANFALSTIFKIIGILVMIVVWTAIYEVSGTGAIENFTLSSLYAYFFLVAIVHTMVDTALDDTMQDVVQSGSVASTLLKPMNFFIKLVSDSFAENALDLTIVALPILLIAILFFHLSIVASNIPLFVVEIVLGNLLILLFGFLIGSLAVYVTRVWGIMSVFWTSVWFMSGMTMPLSFFPVWAQQVLALLPFQLFAYIPVATLEGIIPTSQIFLSLLVGLVWFVVLAVFSHFWWNRTSKKMVSAGG